MLGFGLSQLLHRRGRTLTLAAGLLVATVSFVLLTAAVSTSQLRVVGAVSRNFRPAYDILVRPSNSFTQIERSQGLVQQNYLSGIFGGITYKQYRKIKQIPGIEVAAPIANVGYVLPFQFIPIMIDRYLSKGRQQLYRLRLDWLANNGLSRYPDSDQYVYYTDRPFVRRQEPGGVSEVAPGGRYPVCALNSTSPARGGPFSLEPGEGMMCFSRRTPSVEGGTIDYGPLPPGRVGAVSTAFFPIFVSAIDPVQEAKLVGLDDAVVSGRYLEPNEGAPIRHRGPSTEYHVVPVLASTKTYVDEALNITVERLQTPSERGLLPQLSSSSDVRDFLEGLPGKVVGTERLPIHRFYGRLLNNLSGRIRELEISYNGYWSTGSTTYEQLGPDRLKPNVVSNPQKTLHSSYYGAGWAPQELRDAQFRKVFPHQGSSQFTGELLNIPAIHVIGRFDPSKLPGFSALSRVPLETYYPPEVDPANARASRLLNHQPLLPTANIAGYIAQPPLLLTTLNALKQFTDVTHFSNTDAGAPISVIRIRVAGVTGPDPVSRERIRRVAQAIHQQTGLAVDVTAGSSPHPLTISLPAGRFGQPPLPVREGWVKKGVAVEFLNAVDRKSLVLFGLILLVCTFFVANGVFASVRSRRQEIGTLLCLGWTQKDIFRVVLGEVVLLGLVIGSLGVLIAGLLAALFAFHLGVLRLMLAAPLGAVIALFAGLVPAWKAATSVPLDAVRPAISLGAPRSRVRGIVGMAMLEVRRMPSRTFIAAGALFIGVFTFTMLISIEVAFQGVLIGTLLGGFISLEVRTVDLASVALAVALGGLSVADVLLLNLRDRAPEFVTLRTSGWRDSHLGRLVAVEGTLIGLLGAIPGAVIGAGVAAIVGGSVGGTIVLAIVVGAGVGVVVALVASLIPAVSIGRVMGPTVLAEEW